MDRTGQMLDGKISALLPQVETELLYKPPYRWQEIVEFLRQRAIPGVELVQNGEYLRTVKIGHTSGHIKVAHGGQSHALSLTVSESLYPALPEIQTRIAGLFDLDCNPSAVSDALKNMDHLSPGLYKTGTRVPGCFDPFEISVRAVLGQQITVKAAQTLAGRLASSLGEAIDTGIAGLTHVFPTTKTIMELGEQTEDTLGKLGVIGTRSRSIVALASALESGKLTLSAGADPSEEIKKLVTLPGIGVWTAQYIAMRSMGWGDAFPHTDYGIKKALQPRTPKEILQLAESWRPYRAYAAITLWNSL